MLMLTSNNIFRSFIEQLPTAVAMLDENFRYVLCSDAWVQVLGMGREEFIGHCHYDIFPEAQARRDLHQRALAGESFSSEGELLPFRGSARWFKWKIQGWTHEEKNRGLIIFVEDVTDKMVLQTERERLYQLPNHLLCVLDVGSRFKHVNLGFKETLGYEPEELLGKPIWEFIHPEDLARSQEAEKLGHKEEVRNFENRFRAKSGRYVWIRWTGKVIDGFNYGAGVDISEEKIKEEGLANKERKFSAIFLQSPHPIVLLSELDHRVCDVNDAWINLYGLGRQKVLGKTYEELGLSSGNSWYQSGTREVHRTLPNQSEVVVRCQVQRLTIEHQEFILVHETDLTKNRRLEQLFRTTFDHAAVGIAQVAPDGKWLRVNQRLCEITGYSEDELLVRTFQEITHPEDVGGDLELVQRMLDREIDHYTIEKRYIRKSGEFVWVNLTVALVWKSDSTPDFFISVIEDITRQKEAERERAESLSREATALEASRLKGEFLANMSHEIRTPINAIVGMTNLLLDSNLAPAQHEQAEVVVRSAEHLLGIVNDVLDLSKVEAGKLELEIVPFELTGLLAELNRSLASTASMKKLEFTVASAARWNHRFRGDVGRLRQVLLNLTSNALKFTERGSVSVEVDEVYRDESRVRLRFAITDSGIGIESDVLPKLFTPFSQADTSVSRRFGGTGLGLSISKRLVELMGGEIGVESWPGIGSTFWFTVPLEIGDELAPIAPVSEVPARRRQFKKNVRILVAEDNVTNQKVISMQLEKFGLRPDVVANGSEVLDSLRLFPYDLILMDCQMPEMSGYEATRWIRQSGGEQQNIPIIAMTANAIIGEREKCLDAGMNDYLAKPIRLADLEIVLTRWLPASAQLS